MAQTTSGEDHKFNDDLLMNNEKDRGKTDLEWAKELFPHVFHLLDHPALREIFAEYERQANMARDWVCRLGIAAVVSIAVALIAIATQPIWPEPHTPLTRGVALLIELAGMLAAAVAVGGIWHGKWKHRWLESRLMTERLRQWHFQLLVRWGSQIEESCEGPKGVEHFNKERKHALDNFLAKHDGKLDVELQSLVEKPGYGIWLHDRQLAYSDNSKSLGYVFAAYERLRFEHQNGYATHKLLTSTKRPFSHFLKWPPICQKAALGGVAAFCFISALICSAVLCYGHAFVIPQNVECDVGIAAIVIALIGVALRAIQEGLALDKEIERYSDYRSRTSQLLDRFQTTTNARERLHLMEELELASVDEMKGFLRTHYNVKFVL